MRNYVLNSVGGLSPHDEESGITQDVNLSFVTPQEFGAVGDGIADDTEAIQKAIDAANGGFILIPAGTYKVTSLLVRGTQVE